MSSTRIHWGRVLLGGLLAEVALILAIVPLGLRLGDRHLRRPEGQAATDHHDHREGGPQGRSAEEKLDPICRLLVGQRAHGALAQAQSSPRTGNHMRTGRIVGTLILSLLCVSALAQRSRASKPSSGYANHLIGEKSPYLLRTPEASDTVPRLETDLRTRLRRNSCLPMCIGGSPNAPSCWRQSLSSVHGQAGRTTKMGSGFLTGLRFSVFPRE